MANNTETKSANVETATTTETPVSWPEAKTLLADASYRKAVKAVFGKAPKGLPPAAFKSAIDAACVNRTVDGKPAPIAPWYGSGAADLNRRLGNKEKRQTQRDKGREAGYQAGYQAGIERGKGQGEIVALTALIQWCQDNPKGDVLAEIKRRAS